MSPSIKSTSLSNSLQSGVRLHAWQPFLLATVVSIALNLVLHRHVRAALLNQYPGDSFYTLSAPAAVGLAAITSILLIAVLLLSWLSTMVWIRLSLRGSSGYRSLFFALDISITVAVYILLLVLVPQVFYTYYQWVFSGLPVQWVIKLLPWQVLLDLVRLPSGASMAEHLAGFTLWVIVTNLAIQWIRYRRYARPIQAV